MPDSGNTDLAAQLVEIVKILAAPAAGGGLVGYFAARRKANAEATAIRTSARAAAAKTEAEAHAIETDAVLRATRQLADLWEEQNKGLRDELEALREAMRERDEMDRERDRREREWRAREAELRADLETALAQVAELRAMVQDKSQLVMGFLAPQTKPVSFPATAADAASRE